MQKTTKGILNSFKVYALLDRFLYHMAFEDTGTTNLSCGGGLGAFDLYQLRFADVVSLRSSST